MATQEPEAPASPTIPTKVCPNCGVQSQTTSDKCASCGKKYKQKKGGGCLKWLGIVTLAFIVLIVIIALASGGGKEDAKVSQGTTTGDDGGGDVEQTAGVGDTVELKGTEYTVTKVETADTVGGEFTKSTADGKYVVVYLTLKNLKDEPATILGDAVRLVGNNGKEYTTDTDTLGAFENQFILEQIQPDLAKDVVAVYDIPPGAVSGAKLQVKDLFSDSKGEIDLGL